MSDTAMDLAFWHDLAQKEGYLRIELSGHSYSKVVLITAIRKDGVRATVPFESDPRKAQKIMAALAAEFKYWAIITANNQ